VRRRYRRARELAGLSLPQAAQRIGVTEHFLGAVEGGAVDATHRHRVVMAELYGCTLPWLCGEPVELPARVTDRLRDLPFADRDAISEVIASMWSKPS
jgi:transcriptional regulator with XRE-family HTH domain